MPRVSRISHDLDRRRTLRSLRVGEIPRAEACDAARALRSSAEVLGVRSEAPCPVCGTGELREVAWIYGSSIGEKSGTARSLSEIRAIVATLFPDGSVHSDTDLTVHTVEVCLECGWNHLLREDTYGPDSYNSHYSDDSEPQGRPTSSTERPAR